MKLQLTGNALKIIAMITMFIGHFGMIFFPDISIFIIISRIAFPIYAYLIAEGCKYTRNRTRYFLQIFILGLICSIVFILVERYIYFCVLITFSISILLIYLIDYVRESFGSRCILLILALTLVGILCKHVEIDYGFFGILVPVMTYLPKEKNFKVAMFSISLFVLTIMLNNPLQIYCLISILFIILYNGNRGKLNLKWFFYLFYPVHFILLFGLSLVI